MKKRLMRLILLVSILLLSLQVSWSQSQSTLSENQREFINFYWGNKLYSKTGSSVYPSKVLYDLLTNEIIGTMDEEYIRYYYIPEGSGSPKLSKQITVRGSRNNNIDNQYYCYKFKTYENAIRWLNGERYVSPSTKKSEKNKNQSQEKTYYNNENEYALTNQLVDSKLFGEYKPDLNRLVEYIKSYKNEIYGLKTEDLKIFRGMKFESNFGFSMHNLMSEFSYADSSKSLINNPDYRDEIFEKIYSYVYTGKHPLDPKRNAILYDYDKHRESIFNNNIRYVYLKEVNLFVFMRNGNIQVFDPFLGPLFFKKNSKGFKFYDKQTETVSLFFNNLSVIFQYKPKNNYSSNLPIYFVDNGNAPEDSIGLEFRLKDDNSVNLTTYLEGPISTLPAYGYNNIRYTKINNLDYYIANKLFFKDFSDTINIYTTFQQRQLLYQTGRIDQNQLFNPNFSLREVKLRRGLSGEKEELILNSYGLPITPFFEEISQISNSYFTFKKNNKYGLLFITPETVRQNRMVMLNNKYDSLWGKKEAESMLITAIILNNGKKIKEEFKLDMHGSFLNENKVGEINTGNSNDKEIKTILINKQTWMSDNLNIDHFRNGDTIFHAKTSEQWRNAAQNKIPAWCFYNNDSINGKTYGRMYNYFAVIDPRELAPVGFHVATKDEWRDLCSFYGYKNRGFILKSSDGWINNGGGSGVNGFAGKPGGARSSKGLFGNGSEIEFENIDGIGKMSGWWLKSIFKSATGDSSFVPCYFLLHYDQNEITNVNQPGLRLTREDISVFGKGYYVRCIQD